jgi:hypothetical protein
MMDAELGGIAVANEVRLGRHVGMQVNEMDVTGNDGVPETMTMG